MILCAGLGTRLRPLTDERPKPLVPLDHAPLAAFALDLLADLGVTHLVANAHHLAAQVDPGLRPHADRRGVSLTTLVEPALLGTGGGIRNAIPHLGDGDFVVFNGDVLARPDLAAALSHHRRLGARMTMVLRHHPDADRLGAIEVDADGRVRRALDEGPVPEAPVRRCVFTGVYVLSTSIAPLLPEEGCVVRRTLRALLAAGEPVGGVVDEGPWFDLGTVGRYAEAQFALLRGALPWPGRAPTPGAVSVAPDAVIDPGVTVGPEVIVGAGARVRGRGVISRAIVWDGADVELPCEGEVVGRRSRVAIPRPEAALDGPK